MLIRKHSEMITELLFWYSVAVSQRRDRNTWMWMLKTACTVNLLLTATREIYHTISRMDFTAQRSEVRKHGFSAISQFASKPEECSSTAGKNAPLNLRLLKLYTWIKCKVFTPVLTWLWEKHRVQTRLLWIFYPSGVAAWHVCPPQWETWRCGQSR